MKFSVFGALLLLLAAMQSQLFAAEANSEEREREIRERYEKVLLRNPFQERAFAQVYESYLKYEGMDAWVKKLQTQAEGAEALGAMLLLGQAYERQFKTKEAIAALEKASTLGEKRAPFKVLLGTLYYKSGDDDKAAQLLTSALDDLVDLDQRSSVCRTLGNIYLRQNKRDEAIKVWKRIAEQNPGEIFSQLELAEIYEDNRMWNEAIDVYRGVAAAAKDDPYRRCRALRSIGQCLIQAEKYKEAIATFKQALELVAPGNWLFEDLKLRLVGVYEDIGDLAGLAQYVQARLDQAPGDTEFRDLLAETHTRMAKFDLAEKEYRAVLERNPRSSATYEKLIALYSRTEKKDKESEAFEKLIELFPNDTEYLRRLGESYLRQNNPDKAKETWRRLTKEKDTPERQAELAGWYERYEFADEAAAAYENALKQKKNKDWAFRLASLTFAKGDETNALNLWLSVIDPAVSKAEDYSEVAGILESFSKVKDAVPLRRKAVEKDGKNLEYRLAAARDLMQLEQFEEALTHYDVLADQTENEYFAAQGETGRLDAYRALGIIEQKQKEWEAELAKDPNSSVALTKLARLYERAGQREKAIQLYERRKEIEPENIEFARSLGALYKSGKQTEQAIALYKQLVDKDKNRARVYWKDLLDIYLSVDSKDEAIAAGEKMVSLAPADPEARLDLAQVYAMYQMTDKALSEYRYVLRLEPNEPDYHRQYGDALAQEKRWGEAQEAYRKMLDTAKEDSTRLTAVQNLARIHLQQDSLNTLVTEFVRRVRNTPKKLAAHEELSAIYKEAGQLGKAVEVLEGALQQVDDKEAALKSLIRVTFDAQDFPKVRSYYEQLLALSGKPSANEFEKLGSIYAQMGEIEKARETWNKIVTSAPKDPKMSARLAGIYEREGFSEEALAAQARTLELDPSDYKVRYKYAQMLASSDQQVQALEQLRKLLEYGDKQQANEDKDNKEKKVQALNRGQRNVVNPYQFVYGVRNYGGYYGGGWNGKYKEFRPQVVMFMASIAQQSIGEDNFIKELEERAAKNKENTTFKRDLVMIYQSYNRIEDALKTAQEVLEAAPDDVDLLQQTALYYATQQQIDKAIPLLEKLAASQPKHRKEALSGLIPLYFQKKEEAKALELVDRLLLENPTDMQTIYSMAGMMQNQGKWEKAREIYKVGMNLDPRNKNNLLFQIASSYKQEGKSKEALDTFKNVLLAEAPNYGGYIANRRQASVYVPEIQQVGGGGRYYGGGPLRNFPQNVIGYIDYQKSEAVNELIQANRNGTDTNAFAEFEQLANTYKRNSSPSERGRTWEATKLLSAYSITQSEFDKAASMLQAIHEQGMDDIEWYNLSAYLKEKKENYPAMNTLYKELEQRYPGKSRDVASARTAVAIISKNYGDAAKTIAEMNQQRFPPRMITSMIRPLIQAGEKKVARELLEEHLKTSSRNSEALSMLAGLYGEENDYQRAIALANEAWERKAHGRANNNYMYSSYYGYSGGYAQPDAMLRELHRYYVASGRSEELITTFKERLDKQPSSIQAHENLAELYRLNNQRDKAIEVYQGLSQKMPHLLQTKKAIANLYSESGEFKKATDLYEQLLKDYPTSYQQLSWELRYLYQRIGKGKDLAKIEEKMAEKARNPNQIRQMADNFRQAGDLDKAADLYAKAIKLSPMDIYMKNQLAEVYVEQGKVEDALKLYREYLDSPQMRARGNVDSYSIKRIAGLFYSAGKIDELKERCAKELQRNPDDLPSKTMMAQIAILEKRFDEALNHYDKAIADTRDYNALYEMMELADVTGDITRILAIVDKAGGNQQNFWDHQRMARFFLALGNTNKANEYVTKWIDQRLNNGGGGWEYNEILQTLSSLQMWNRAEEFVKKNQRAQLEQWEAEQFDRTLINGYANGGHFRSYVEEVTKKDALKGRDLDLVKRLSQHYRDTNNPQKRRELLEKILAVDTKNRELAFELAEVYGSINKREKQAEILARLTAEDVNNVGYRRSYYDALIELGRGEEVLDSIQKWTNEKAVEERYSMLADYQKKLGLFKQSRETLNKVRELADSSKKADIDFRIAEFEAEQGRLDPYKSQLIERYRKVKDAGSFQRAFDGLRTAGYSDEAYKFFVAEKDGFVDRYRGREFLSLCYNAGDSKTSLDMNWQFLRYGERWDRDYYFQPVREFFQYHGKAQILLSDFKTRIDNEPQVNPQLLFKLGETYREMGYPEQAIAVYDKLLARNPYDQETWLKKADLLGSLKKSKEAVELLRSRKLPRSLNEEVSQKVQLIKVALQNKQNDIATDELTNLVAWAKGGIPLRQLGDLYFEQKDYTRALEFYTQSQKVQRGYDYGAILSRLGLCLTHLNKTDEALKLVHELADQSNPYDIEMGMAAVTEGDYLLARTVAEDTITRNPANLSAYVRLANIQAKEGKIDAAFATLNRAEKALDPEARSSLLSEAGSLLAINDLIAQACARKEDLLIRDALINTLGRYRDNKKKAAPIIESLKGYDPSDPALCASLGDSLVNLGEKEQALPLLAKALAANVPVSTKVLAADTLFRAGEAKQAIGVLGELFKTHPHLFTSDYSLFSAAVQGGDETFRHALEKRALDSVLFPEQVEFFAFLSLNAQGDKDKAAIKLSTLATMENLSPSQLVYLATVAKELNKSAERVKVLERLAGGGYGEEVRLNSLRELVTQYSAQAEFHKALAAYIALFPTWGQTSTEKCLKSMIESITPANLADFRKALIAKVVEDPARDANSDLLGTYFHLAQMLGHPEPIEQLISEGNLDGIEKQESIAWSTLIKTWQIAGPYVPFSSSAEEIFPPEPGAKKGATTEWKTIDPAKVPGIVRLSDLLGLDQSDLSNKIAYAKTEIESPEERAVTLMLGSDDWIEAWLNGERVHSSRGSHRSIALDQDRVPVQLKAGKNTLLLKVGNATDAWSFCARIRDNANGLKIAEIR